MERTFGRLLRQQRKQAGLNLKDVAEHLQLTISYISDVERGNRTPFSTDRIYLIAQLFETDPKPLLVAAAESQGAFELDAVHVSTKAREVGAALMRGWSELSDEELEQIARILGRRGSGE